MVQFNPPGSGKPPLTRRVEGYSVSEIGRSEIDQQAVHKIFIRAHDELNTLFVGFARRKDFQHEASELAEIMEALGRLRRRLTGR